MSESITISKNTLWKVATFVLAVVVIWLLVSGGSGSGNSGGNNNNGGGNTNIDMDDLIDDDAVIGDKDAPVTIVEWSDYECPFCQRHYTQTYNLIKKDYIDTGKVRYVLRDFPLSFHPQAQKAAEAAECAGEQGKYFEMHDKLFGDGVVGGVATFKGYASDLGLDRSKFDSCLDSGKMASEVAADMQDGIDVGISGTPGFIINGKLVSGAQPYSVFKQAIDAEL